MLKIEVKITDKPLYANIGVPQYATPGACAVDLRSTVDAAIKPGECLPIDTGLSIHCGSAYGEEHPRLDDMGICALILPRSGLGANKGLVMGNLVGLIDEDYQGPLIVSAWNRNEQETKKVITFQRGERIAQMVFMLVLKPKLSVVEDFSISTQRGEGGFGSTGRA